MRKNLLPKIRLASRPKGLEFRKPSAAVMARYDPLIRSAKKEAAEIEILGAIGEDIWSEEFTTAKSVKSQLKSIGSNPVLITLNSPGGDAFEGIAIYNLLREHPGEVTVNVLGLAASAASVIAMAGDTVRMGDAAMLMIHSAWGVVMGNQQDMQDMASVLDGIDRSVAGLYAARTGMSESDVLEMMQAETWLSAQDAVDMGFADELGTGRSPGPRSKQSRATSAIIPPAASGNRGGVSVQLSAAPKPGVSGSNDPINPKGSKMKTIAEQIAAFTKRRDQLAASMDEIMSAAAEDGETLDETQTQEYDGYADDLKSVDNHIVRLQAHEARMVATAKPIVAAEVNNPNAGPGSRQPERTGIISVKSQVPKGIAFTRYVKALAIAKGNLTGALAIAQNNQTWRDTTPMVEKVLMAAVAGGDTTTSGWASELVYNENLVNEFIEILRPQTIIGRLPGLTNVPFNVRMSGSDSGSTAYWVGQGAPTPVSKMNTIEVTLGIAKAAGLVVLTEELVRSSAPSAEMLVRDDLTKSIAQFLDVHFVDPGYAAVSNVSPASITNGVNATAPTGTNAAALRTDVQTLFNNWIQNNINPMGGAWIMSPTLALAISLMRTSLDVAEFPGLTLSGGTFQGLPVVVSNSANIAGSPLSGDMIILVNSPDILMADDGQITIDASREASLQMLDNPTNNAAAGTPTTMVSMFQTNSVAIRAVRFINWAKKRSTAVEFIQDAAYRA